jgi:23S rRNA pseudouridine1911/1915/1917 synthase
MCRRLAAHRGDTIRTCDFLLPKQALYQAELRPVRDGNDSGAPQTLSGSRLYLSEMSHTQPTILHRTEQWLVLGKPAGWHTVSGQSDEPDMESWLRVKIPACSELEEAGLVHRLDLPTSGCLLAATDEIIRQTLRDAMSGRGNTRIEKQYVARCAAGLPQQGAFELYFTKRHRGSRKMTVSKHGAERTLGKCTWNVLSRSGKGDLVELELLGPGRRHMLRAGMAFLGHPLVGDTLYGGSTTNDSPLLHARRLIISGLAVESPAPPWAL